MINWYLQHAALDSSKKNVTRCTSDLSNPRVSMRIYIYIYIYIYIPPWRYTTHSGCVFYSPLSGFSLLAYEVTWSHTATRHSRWDSSERMISSSQRPLPDNTQHSQQINIHAPGGIRTHDRSRRAAVDLHLRPRGYWDWQYIYIYAHTYIFFPLLHKQVQWN